MVLCLRQVMLCKQSSRGMSMPVSISPSSSLDVLGLPFFLHGNGKLQPRSDPAGSIGALHSLSFISQVAFCR